ncbi:TPA: hypothetical protein N0F65_005001 [Lagenidium giganteum]|uniref:Uncharacterized protein n=1 Tax=Lagenidium giganteum TaxID=4803 RepID=A0AAV2ZGH9_9STRA|nr:TPA: hypothetical protein N0F65_005001 [Lagenidium giganteum]
MVLILLRSIYQTFCNGTRLILRSRTSPLKWQRANSGLDSSNPDQPHVLALCLEEKAVSGSSSICHNDKQVARTNVGGGWNRSSAPGICRWSTMLRFCGCQSHLGFGQGRKLENDNEKRSLWRRLVLALAIYPHMWYS